MNNKNNIFILIFLVISFVFIKIDVVVAACGDNLSYEGESYSTVEIGSQCWMAENLNVGTRIDSASSQTDNSTLEKYCYDNNESSCDTYGGLYQWDEIMQYSTTEGIQGICPSGWHVPTHTEWYDLELQYATGTCASDTMGFTCDPAGEALLSGGLSGFNALLVGYYNGSSFSSIGTLTMIASSHLHTGTTSRSRYLRTGYTTISRWASSFSQGLSVRCIQDAVSSSYILTYNSDSNGSITGDSPQTVEEGTDGTSVAAVPDINYHFVDWSDGSTDNPRTDTNITGDITVTANFAIDQYTVDFEDYDRSNLKTETINYGSSATAPTDPTRTGYTFTGWDVDFSNITSNLIVTAQYSANPEPEPTPSVIKEEPEESPTIKIKEIQETCNSLELELSTGGAEKKEDLDIKVKIENTDTGEEIEQKFSTDTNIEGRATITIKNVDQDTEYKLKVKYKRDNEDEYTDWSDTKKANTTTCSVSLITTPLYSTEDQSSPEQINKQQREEIEEEQKDGGDKKDGKKEESASSETGGEEERGFPMEAVATTAAVAGGGVLIGGAWINRNKWFSFLAFTWMKKRNWRVFDVETGDAIEGALVSLESPEGEILEEELTDNKGHFKFKASPGNNTMKVEKDNYQMIQRQEKEIIEEYGEIYTGGSLNNNRDVFLNINIPMRRIEE